MKITNIQTIPLGYMKDLPKIPRSFALVRVETDKGIIGYGEASTSYGHFYPKVVESIVDEAVSRAIIGKDPTNIQDRLQDLNLYINPWLGWEGITSQVIGAVEIALWDILGKANGMSISELWGGGLKRIPLYATGTTYPEKGPEWHGKFFDHVLERGFAAVKTRIGSPYKKAIAQIAGVREYIGDDLVLLVDGYWTYSTETAIRLAKEMEEYDVYWFEEPIPQYRLNGLERLCEESPVNIAVGERIYSLSGFENVITRNAAHILQPDPTVCGGIYESMEIAALAKANDMKVFPHIGGLTAVGIAAVLHFASVIKTDFLEYDSSPYQPLRDELLKDPIFSLDNIEDGYISVPEKPGLGIEIDEACFEEFAYEPGSDVYPDIYPQLGMGEL